MNDTTLILLMGMVYAVGEAIQLIYMAYQQKRTADLIDGILNDKELGGRIMTNALVGLSESLQDDEQSRAAVYSLMANLGNAAYSLTKTAVTDSIKKTISKEIPVPKKYRWLYELISPSDKAGAENSGAQAPGKLSPL